MNPALPIEGDDGFEPRTTASAVLCATRNTFTGPTPKTKSWNHELSEEDGIICAGKSRDTVPFTQ